MRLWQGTRLQMTKRVCVFGTQESQHAAPPAQLVVEAGATAPHGHRQSNHEIVPFTGFNVIHGPSGPLAPAG